MSIKVYLHYEPLEGPEKTSKLSVPKKWVTDKQVSDVIELFTDSYNKANPDFALNKDEVHLTNKEKEPIYSNSIVGDVLEDRTDYFIKQGSYIKKAITKTQQTNQLRCKNFGCGKSYLEEENTDTSCIFHCSPPYFHDTIKGWTCCKDKKAYDWDEFQSIIGCTIGKHSNIDQKSLFTTENNNGNDIPDIPKPILKSIDDYNNQNPEATTAATSALKSLNTRKSSRNNDGITARCQNKGCQKQFEIALNNEIACCYHSGQPVFHDAIKFWSCCSNIKCYDFDEFMAVNGCCNGYHDDGVIELNEKK